MPIRLDQAAITQDTLGVINVVAYRDLVMCDRRPAVRWREAAASRQAPTCGLAFPTTILATTSGGGQAEAWWWEAGKANKDKGPAVRDRRQAVTSGELESSEVGDDAARQDCVDCAEGAQQEPEKPAAAASGEASTVLTTGELRNPTCCIRILLFFKYIFFHMHSIIIHIIVYFGMIIIGIIILCKEKKICIIFGKK